MSILIDQEDNEVNLNQGVEADAEQAPAEEVAEEAGFEMPDKLKGKSAEEIAAIYVAEQNYVGDLRNQLGDYRSMTDRFLSMEEKRVADLEEAGADASTYEIDATELLSNPEKVLEEFYENRRAKDTAYVDLQERLNRIEGQVGTNALNERHSDAETITADPAFQQWVGAHPVRQSIAQSAVQNRDVDQLDYLLTEWKERNPGTAEASPTSRNQNELRAAKSVVTESNSASGNSSTSGKPLSRRKLVQLKMNNPDEYSAMSEEILKAYAEGRVID